MKKFLISIILIITTFSCVKADSLYPLLSKRFSISPQYRLHTLGLGTNGLIIILHGFDIKGIFEFSKRVNLGISYTGLQFNAWFLPKDLKVAYYLNNAELDIAVRIREKENRRLFLTSGLIAGQYRPYRLGDSLAKKNIGYMYKMGLRSERRLKSHNRVYFVSEFNLYLNLNKPSSLYFHIVGNIGIGLRYRFN